MLIERLDILSFTGAQLAHQSVDFHIHQDTLPANIVLGLSGSTRIVLVLHPIFEGQSSVHDSQDIQAIGLARLFKLAFCVIDSFCSIDFSKPDQLTFQFSSCSSSFL